MIRQWIAESRLGALSGRNCPAIRLKTASSTAARRSGSSSTASSCAGEASLISLANSFGEIVSGSTLSMLSMSAIVTPHLLLSKATIGQ